jgi:hypothetical protein
LFGVKAFALSAVTFHSGIVTEAGHGMTPFFILYALPLGVLAVTEFQFLTPKAYVG